MKKALVSILMGSDSDLTIMKDAAEFLDELGVPNEVNIVSAHRTPDRLFKFAKDAEGKGIKVIIAGAGGAAHLPGMLASITPIPVIGVPIKSRNSIDGWDSVLSILQMPAGVPVATVALNGGRNAGILAAQILGTSDSRLRKKIVSFKESLSEQVAEKIKKLKKEGYKNYTK